MVVNWEGKTGAENRAEDLQNFIRWIDGEDNPAGTTGERRSEVAARAIRAITKALADKTDQVLVVTTHGGTARCILGSLLQLPMSHWGVIGGLSNASWSVLERNPRQWHLVEHNAGSIPEPVFGEESGATPA
jgi:glucosyl-3-phosphoglycerate phosphatase